MLFGGNCVALTVAELFALPHVQYSVPYRVRLGQVWRRRDPIDDNWLMGEYVLDHKANYTAIRWRQVIELP